MIAFSIGLDVHQNTSTYCVLDRQGRHVRTATVKGRWDKLLQSLQQVARQGPIAVAYEASLGYGTLHDRLARFCGRVAVGHPGRLRLIFNTKHARTTASMPASSPRCCCSISSPRSTCPRSTPATGGR